MSLDSLFSIIPNIQGLQNANQLQEPANGFQTTIHEDMDRLVRELGNLVKIQPKPFVFLKSNNSLSSNVNDGILIVRGTTIPANSRGTIRDFNINFTTVAGTVRVVITDSSGNIRQDILRGVNASTNGVGETVLEEGESLAIVGQTAGAGVFTVFCSGQVQLVR